MEGINDELDLAITGIAFSLTAPIGLYTVNHDSLDAVQDGNTVALSNDPDNQERAIRILEELVWEERRAIVSIHGEDEIANGHIKKQYIKSPEIEDYVYSNETLVDLSYLKPLFEQLFKVKRFLKIYNHEKMP